MSDISDLVLVYNDGFSNSRIDIADLDTMQFLPRRDEWSRGSNEFAGEDGIKYFDIPEAVAALVPMLKDFKDIGKISITIAIARGATANLMALKGVLLPESITDTNGRKRRGVLSYFNQFSQETEGIFDGMMDAKTRYSECGLPKNLGGALVHARTLVGLTTEHPSLFENASRFALAPEILARQFTGDKMQYVGPELTYMACHSGLYDFRNHGWSELAKKIDDYIYEKTGKRLIGDLMQKRFYKSWWWVGYVDESLVSMGMGAKTKVLYGGHDSTIADVPVIAAYKAQVGDKPFVHFQAGSWGMARLIGAEYTGLPEEGFRKGILLQGNLDGDAVPAAQTPTGIEFKYYGGKDEETGRLGVILEKLSLGKLPKGYTLEKVKQIIQDRKIFITPGIDDGDRKVHTKGLGPFPDSVANIYGENEVYADGTGETAYIALNLETSIVSMAGKEVVAGKETDMVVSSGGAEHDLYLKLLATLMPNKNIYSIRGSNGELVTETTANGGLVLARANKLKIHPYEVDVSALGKLKKVEPIKELIEPLKDYRAEFEKRCNPN